MNLSWPYFLTAECSSQQLLVQVAVRGLTPRDALIVC